MHQRVKDYIEKIKEKFSKNFENCICLDVGSADINWNFRYLFTNCHLIGIDIHEYKNVDIVVNVNDYTPWILFDTIFSVEMLEHDKTRKKSIAKMYSLLKKWWLLVCTCANIARREHWTTEFKPHASPATNDYYRNLDGQDVLSILPNAIISEDSDREDLRFYILKE